MSLWPDLGFTRPTGSSRIWLKQNCSCDMGKIVEGGGPKQITNHPFLNHLECGESAQSWMTFSSDWLNCVSLLLLWIQRIIVFDGSEFCF